MWTAKHLSYAGRRILVQSVLQAMSNYWASMLIIPQSIVKLIDDSCRKFLWGTKKSGKAIAMVNWNQVCTPKENGGLGLKRCGEWNRAMIGKQLWEIAAQGESMWVKWVHNRYIKQRTIWTVELTTNTSWHWRKLLKVRDRLLPAINNGEWMPSRDGKYTPNSGYMWFLGELPTFPLAKVVWNRFNIPKNGFIMWLAVLGKLLTRDRIIHWGVGNIEDSCVLCGVEKESIDHPYFKCQFSRTLCGKIDGWLKIREVPHRTNEWKHWLVHLSRRGHVRNRIWEATVSAGIAMIWRERNARIHNKGRKSESQVFFKLKREVTIRVLGCMYGSHNEQIAKDILQV